MSAYSVGIDCWRGAGAIDWAKAKVGDAGWGPLTFVYVKASEGLTVDSEFRRLVDGVLAAGIRCGAYGVLGYGLSHSAEDQAGVFLRTAAPAGCDMPPMLDFEVPQPGSPDWDGHVGTLSPRALAWCKTVTTGYRAPLVYTYPDFADHLPACPELDDLVDGYDLWIASYRDQRHLPAPGSQPYVPRAWRARGRSWAAWQTSGDGGLAWPGVPFVVDHDVWAGPLPPKPGAASSPGPDAYVEDEPGALQ